MLTPVKYLELSFSGNLWTRVKRRIFLRNRPKKTQPTTPKSFIVRAITLLRMVTVQNIGDMAF